MLRGDPLPRTFGLLFLGVLLDVLGEATESKSVPATLRSLALRLIEGDDFWEDCVEGVVLSATSEELFLLFTKRKTVHFSFTTI